MHSSVSAPSLPSSRSTTTSSSWCASTPWDRRHSERSSLGSSSLQARNDPLPFECALATPGHGARQGYDERLWHRDPAWRPDIRLYTYVSCDEVDRET